MTSKSNSSDTLVVDGNKLALRWPLVTGAVLLAAYAAISWTTEKMTRDAQSEAIGRIEKRIEADGQEVVKALGEVRAEIRALRTNGVTHASVQSWIDSMKHANAGKDITWLPFPKR